MKSAILLVWEKFQNFNQVMNIYSQFLFISYVYSPKKCKIRYECILQENEVNSVRFNALICSLSHRHHLVTVVLLDLSKGPDFDRFKVKIRWQLPDDAHEENNGLSRVFNSSLAGHNGASKRILKGPRK